MAGIIDYANQELDLYFPVREDEDELDKTIRERMRANVMQLIETFESQGHSGFSASAVLQMFDRLAHYKPITSLTGADDEWEDVDEGTFQNKRCSSVFKDKETGMAYDINGKVFSDDGGKTYHMTAESKNYISFPYNPPTKPRKIILKSGKKENNDGEKEKK